MDQALWEVMGDSSYDLILYCLASGGEVAGFHLYGDQFSLTRAIWAFERFKRGECRLLDIVFEVGDDFPDGVALAIGTFRSREVPTFLGRDLLVRLGVLGLRQDLGGWIAAWTDKYCISANADSYDLGC